MRRAPVILVAIGLTACAVPGSVRQGSATPLPTVGEGSVEALVRARFATLATPGAVVAVQRGNEPVLRFALGEMGAEPDALPMDIRSHMRIASFSEVIVGNVVLQLADEGVLELDAPVSQYVPSMLAGDEITVRMLGMHRSGYFNTIADPTLRAELDADPTRHYETDRLLEVAFGHGLNFEPGSKFEYSNTNIIVLALIVEAVERQPIKAILKKRVLSRVGAGNTRPATSWRLPDPMPRGYRNGPFARSIDYGSVFYDATDFDPSWAGAAGNMYSTLDDVLRLAKPLITGEWLSDSGKASLMGFSPSNEEGLEYSFCLVRENGAIGHAGDVPGFSNYVFWVPQVDATVIVLANLSNTPTHHLPAEALGETIVAALLDYRPLHD